MQPSRRQKKGHKRTARRAIAAALAVACAIALAHVLEVALTPTRDDQRATSCVIVLGAAVWPDGKPSPVYEGRLRYGVERARASGAHLIVTGGIGAGDTVSEADVGLQYAVAHGMRRERVLVERASRTTAENVRFAKGLVDDARLGPQACALVSDPLHLPRALVLARDAHLDVFPAATPHTRYVGPVARARLLASEAWYLFKHRLP